MARIFLIYFVVLTAAEFAMANGTSRLYVEPSTPSSQGEVTYADMKPVKADGKNVAPPVLEFSKAAINPEPEALDLERKVSDL